MEFVEVFTMAYAMSLRVWGSSGSFIVAVVNILAVRLIELLHRP
jgi:hypothetical protein